MHETLHSYIVGPMSGLPRLNFDAFDDMAASLMIAGYVVLSPADLLRANGIDPEGAADQCTNEDIAFFMRANIHALLQCDFAVALPGWERSASARCELHVARATGLQVFDNEMMLADLSALDEQKPE